MAGVSGKIFPVGGRAAPVTSTLNIYRVFKKDGIPGLKVLFAGQRIINISKSALREQLLDILKKHKNRMVVIYPPNIDWNIPIFKDLNKWRWHMPVRVVW